ncbi:hypothetical protein [Methylobacterium sp. Gmos1]
MDCDLISASMLRLDKGAPHHLHRLAVVYFRQSTLQQIEQHRESSRLQ